jgi:hypothetical protein
MQEPAAVRVVEPAAVRVVEPAAVRVVEPAAAPVVAVLRSASPTDSRAPIRPNVAR